MRDATERTGHFARRLKLALFLISVLLAPILIAPTASASYTEECWTADATELWLLHKVNAVRRVRGLAPVRLDDHLSRVAQSHSHVMRSEQRLFHTSDRRLDRQVTGEEALGENVGWGTSSERLFEAFMDSRPHRSVILDRHFKFLGIGASYQDGDLWTTLLFESESNPGTTMRMARC
jgi:uncharacterized protein YkwD